MNLSWLVQFGADVDKVEISKTAKNDNLPKTLGGRSGYDMSVWLSSNRGRLVVG